LGKINPLLNDETLCARFEEQARISEYKMSIGSTNVFKDDDYFTGDDPHIDFDWKDIPEDTEFDWEGIPVDGQEFGKLDFDDIMVSAVDAGHRRGADAEHLAKVWRINLKTTQHTIDVTSQCKSHTPNPKLSKNYGTNDRML
jgi:hypothetical protein